ncbi:MAG TPA: ATP-binding cassette domain-containing protein [Gemmatimonadaceae bacterium]|nr:ATP-binding cassette domain-containing protein [Gemmatimonadaceae bacterium]
MTPDALSLQSIVKRFGPVTALDGAALTVASGTVHALLGENGAGKTTLMRIAYGLDRPDAGVVELDGHVVGFRSPADAIAHGVGMVQQHFSLVPAMSVTDNLALGGRGRYQPREAAERVRALAQRTSLRIDPDARVGDLPPAAQQKLELLKIFARDARVLILDEPTAVLAPAEAVELMTLLRRVADGGSAVVLVTHKLREALAIADEVTVLRRGRTVLTAPARAISEEDLARAMFPDGGAAEPPTLSPREPGALIADLDEVELRDARGVVRLHNASMGVRAGEILGIAGVEGSGHHELLLALAGRLAPARGELRIPADVAFIPEHRQRDALIPSFTVTENVALRGAGSARGHVRWRDVAQRARALVDQHGIRAGNVNVPVRTLSGGNQQKLVLARELDGEPQLVVVENPTQGLDVRAAAAIRERLKHARDGGAAVVVHASDLDELLALADRVIVAFGGRVQEIPLDADRIGRAMLGA